MFKTIEECKLELVSHTVFNDVIQSSVDFMPCSSARVSFGKEDKTGKSVEADKKLMKYLADNQHMSPFEHQSATFLVEVPLFIRSQIMRHRTFAYNEISRRYTDENLEFWVPSFHVEVPEPDGTTGTRDASSFRKQSVDNRQASVEELWPTVAMMYPSEKCVLRTMYGDRQPIFVGYTEMLHQTLETYKAMVAAGVCREQARAVLPQSLLTKFYMTGNLRNWAHFIELRKDTHAQKEVQIVAERIESELRKLWPNSMEALIGV